MFISTVDVAIGQLVGFQDGKTVGRGIVMETWDSKVQRHYGIAMTEDHEEAAELRDSDSLLWITEGKLRLQPWALTRDPGSIRMHTHRVLDGKGRFHAASDLRDCERMARTLIGLGEGAQVERNHPVWYNDYMNPDYAKGDDVVTFMWGHP